MQMSSVGNTQVIIQTNLSYSQSYTIDTINKMTVAIKNCLALAKDPSNKINGYETLRNLFNTIQKCHKDDYFIKKLITLAWRAVHYNGTSYSIETPAERAKLEFYSSLNDAEDLLDLKTIKSNKGVALFTQNKEKLLKAKSLLKPATQSSLSDHQAASILFQMSKDQINPKEKGEEDGNGAAHQKPAIEYIDAKRQKNS